MKPTIYVITYHEFNHGNLRPQPRYPLDPRFLDSDKNYVYYLIDKQVPEPLLNKKTILEYDLDPDLHLAGGKFFGEWSFLLAEEKHSFCEYPFFMVSSRFYEKNSWLLTNLNNEWDQLFDYLRKYGWGYLPSYDRPLRWIDLSWEKKVRAKAWEYQFYPYREKTFELIKDVFNVRIPQDYRYTPDLFCNYIGFNSRKELLEYVQFYKPLINKFFDTSYHLKDDFSAYVRNSGSFRNEKSFTFILEMLSHLFFFKTQKNIFTLHYNGYHEVNTSKTKMTKLKHFSTPFAIACKRFLRWQARRMKTEGYLAPIRAKLKKYIFSS